MGSWWFGKLTDSAASDKTSGLYESSVSNAVGSSTSQDISIMDNSPSSKRLSDNLIKAGVVPPSYKHAAHHIVAGSAAKADSARKILQRYGISNINSSVNGIFLPTERGVSKAAHHPSLHTNSYYDKVNTLLGEATSQEDVLDILDYVREELNKGTF